MKMKAIAVVLAGAQLAAAAHYAVLVAGSSTFANYRHQADVCHASKLLRGNGVPPENIITMAFDDIAHDPSNPFPGQVFNHPNGTDVYAGCNASYTGDDVSAANFLAVLTGNASVVPPGKPVLQSGPHDEVFVYFADHGASGFVVMPTGDFVYASDLLAALETMHARRMYRKLTFYMEACESGSMFDGVLPGNISVYATTAANAFESSWGTYCPPDDIVNGTEIGSCLGDTYSVNWLENADAVLGAGANETLRQQFVVVANETTTSHVQRFGDFTFQNWTIGVFEGSFDPPPHHHQEDEEEEEGPAPPAAAQDDIEPSETLRRLLYKRPGNPDLARESGGHGAPAGQWDSRYATLWSLSTRLERMGRGHALYNATAALHAEEVAIKAIYDDAFETIAVALLQQEGQATGSDTHARSDTAALMAAQLARRIPYHDWPCYQAAIGAVQATCGRASDYALRYMRLLALACTLQDTAAVVTTAVVACKGAVVAAAA